MTDTTLDLATLAKTARDTANALFSIDPCTNRIDGAPCMEQERKRPITKAERDRSGGTMRGFYMYDASRMCRSCATYWHAECTALLLDEKVRVDARYPPAWTRP